MTTRRPSAALAAALSFIVPGLGQAYARHRRAAILFAAPVAVLVGMASGALLLDGEAVLRALLVPGALVALFVANLALAAWRLAAIGHAGLSDGRPRPATLAVVILLAAATVGMHAWAGGVVLAADRALASIFATPVVTEPAPGPTAGHPDPVEPTYRWDGTTRINFLLLGLDSGPGRVDELTDTIMVVTIDPVARTAALISVPRDSGYLPLADRHVYADGIFPRRINELYSVANEDSGLWCPDLGTGADCGLRMVTESVGLYLGLEVHYVARVDLLGFASLVDAMGGVELCLPGVLADPRYGGPTWSGPRGVVLEAGCHVYDGPHALAYARIRQGTLTLPDGTVETQDDFKRAARQQEFLLAVQRQLTGTNLFLALPTLLEAVAQTVTTDFPRAQAGDLATLAPLITAGDIERVVLGWPGYVDLPVDPLTYYLLIPRRDAIRDQMASLLGGPEALGGWYLGSTAAGPPS